MATPNITSGVAELQKPRAYPPNSVFRFESTLGNGSSITTPIFDCVGDGWPLTEIEVGAVSVVRVPSKAFGVFVQINTTAGMRLAIHQISDNGGQQILRQIYIPLDDTLGQYVGWTCPGRRCQFRLLNSPFAVAGVNSSTIFEVFNG
jgi:hypothetical protein